MTTVAVIPEQSEGAQLQVISNCLCSVDMQNDVWQSQA